MADQVTRGRFVGRARELARLRQLLAGAADGTPLLALLGGEAGVGVETAVGAQPDQHRHRRLGQVTVCSEGQELPKIPGT